MTPPRTDRTPHDAHSLSTIDNATFNQQVRGWSNSWTCAGSALLYLQETYTGETGFFLLCDDQNRFQMIACSAQQNVISLGVCSIGTFANPGPTPWATYLLFSHSSTQYILAYEPQGGTSAIYELPAVITQPSSTPASLPLPLAWSGTLDAGWTALAPFAQGDDAGVIAYNAQSGALRSFMITDPSQGPQPVGPAAQSVPGWTQLLCSTALETQDPVLIIYNQSQPTDDNLALYQIGEQGALQGNQVQFYQLDSGWEQLTPAIAPGCFLASGWDPAANAMSQAYYHIMAANQAPTILPGSPIIWPDDHWNLVAAPIDQLRDTAAGCDAPQYFLGYDSDTGNMNIMGIIPPPCGD